MRRFPYLVLGFASLVGCAAEGAGQEPLKPQPEPEQGLYLAIEPDLVRFERTAEALIVTGLPGALETAGMQIVVTERRPLAPFVEVAGAADASFAATLQTTGATIVQLTPVLGDHVGTGLSFRVDPSGVATRLAASCLTGLSGMWQLGNVHEGPARLSETVRIINHCDHETTLEALSPRFGTELSVDAAELPVALSVGQEIQIPLRFELSAGELQSGPARYDFVEVKTLPAFPDSEIGFAVRVTRDPSPVD